MYNPLSEEDVFLNQDDAKSDSFFCGIWAERDPEGACKEHISQNVEQVLS